MTEWATSLKYMTDHCCRCYHLLLFSVLIGQQLEKTTVLCKVANPAHCLLKREKRIKYKVWQRTAHPPRTLLVRRKDSLAMATHSLKDIR